MKQSQITNINASNICPWNIAEFNKYWTTPKVTRNCSTAFCSAAAQRFLGKRFLSAGA